MIELRFDKNPERPLARVLTADRSLAPISSMLDNDLQTPAMARHFNQLLREVVDGKRAQYEGTGNAYYVRADSQTAHVGIDNAPDPTTVAVPTADLIEAIETWAKHLEHGATATRNQS